MRRVSRTIWPARCPAARTSRDGSARSGCALSRRVLWLRHLWSGHHYESEHLLAISHSEVDRILTSPAEAAEAEQAFYRSDERAAAATTQIAALTERPGDAPLRHLVGTLGLSPADVALFTLAASGGPEPSDRPRVRVPARRDRRGRSDAGARRNPVRASRPAAVGPGLRTVALAARGAGRDRTRRIRVLDRLAGRHAATARAGAAGRGGRRVPARGR